MGECSQWDCRDDKFVKCKYDCATKHPSARTESLAKPLARRLRTLYDEKAYMLEPGRRDKIKSSLEEDYFMSPEQTEQYFQALRLARTAERKVVGTTEARKNLEHMEKEAKRRHNWLVNLSGQIAYRVGEYVSKNQDEIVMTNRMRAIADVVLQRVAEILGEPKPSRTSPGRLPRFMVAVSDRIAFWIENMVYRAEALGPEEEGTETGSDSEGR